MFGIVRGEVNLAAEFLGFARLQTADARIAVEADDDSLEEFLGVIPGRGEDARTIFRIAAD